MLVAHNNKTTCHNVPSDVLFFLTANHDTNKCKNSNT